MASIAASILAWRPSRPPAPKRGPSAHGDFSSVRLKSQKRKMATTRASRRCPNARTRSQAAVARANRSPCLDWSTLARCRCWPHQRPHSQLGRPECHRASPSSAPGAATSPPSARGARLSRPVLSSGLKGPLSNRRFSPLPSDQRGAIALRMPPRAPTVRMAIGSDRQCTDRTRELARPARKRGELGRVVILFANRLRSYVELTHGTKPRFEFDRT